MFKGSIVAIVTPFKGGIVDYSALELLIEWHIANGTAGIVPCGTTGEAPTLTPEEHRGVIAHTVRAVNHRVPVIAGTGSNSTREAIELTEAARLAGADAALIITPYYNKPTQEGLYRHYWTIAENVDIPMVLYNVPGRTAVNLQPSTVARLAKDCSNVWGIKEASGNLNQVAEIFSLCGDFTVLSGNDDQTLEIMKLGGKGVISVTANVAPDVMSLFCGAFIGGDTSRAAEIDTRLQPLHRAMFLETNPIPVKTALAMMNKIKGEFRLPLCDMDNLNQAKLAEVLATFSLI